MNRKPLKLEEQVSRAEIKVWAKSMNVSPYYIWRELQRELNLERARKEPDKWTVLKYPSGEINAFSVAA